MHDLIEQTQTAADALGLNEHRTALVTENLTDTWFCMHGLEDVAASGTGTRPGLTVANCLFNYTFRGVVEE
eukprot:9833002-Lingulodinium_polyedra.AAC.1